MTTPTEDSTLERIADSNNVVLSALSAAPLVDETSNQDLAHIFTPSNEWDINAEFDKNLRDIEEKQEERHNELVATVSYYLEEVSRVSKFDVANKDIERLTKIYSIDFFNGVKQQIDDYILGEKLDKSSIDAVISLRRVMDVNSRIARKIRADTNGLSITGTPLKFILDRTEQILEYFRERYVSGTEAVRNDILNVSKRAAKIVRKDKRITEMKKYWTSRGVSQLDDIRRVTHQIVDGESVLVTSPRYDIREVMYSNLRSIYTSLSLNHGTKIAEAGTYQITRDLLISLSGMKGEVSRMIKRILGNDKESEVDLSNIKIRNPMRLVEIAGRVESNAFKLQLSTSHDGIYAIADSLRYKAELVKYSNFEK